MKRIIFGVVAIAACAASLFAVAGIAHAQELAPLGPPSTYAVASPAPVVIDGEVNVGWGTWVDMSLAWAQTLIIAGVAWLLRKLPGEFAGVLGALRVDQLLGKAVDYGINATRDAVRDKTLSFKVGNEVLERAFEYALRHAPHLVAKFGGAAALREKLIARIQFDAESEVPAPRGAAQALADAA